MGKLKEFTQDELNYFLTLPNVITSSKYSKMDIFGKDLGGFIVLKFIPSNKNLNIRYPSYLCKCQCGRLFLCDAERVMSNKVYSCGKCNEKVIEFLRQFKSLKDLSQEDIKWILKTPIYLVKYSKYQEVKVGTIIKNVKILKYLPSLGTNYGPQYICECLICKNLFLASAHLVMSGSYKTCGSKECLKKIGTNRGKRKENRQLNYSVKDYPIIEKIGKEGFETLSEKDKELLIRIENKCRAINKNNFIFKDIVKLKRANGVYGRVLIECKLCHSTKDIRLKDWINKNSTVTCNNCNINTDLKYKESYRFKNFKSEKYLYLGKGKISKGIRYIWLQCKDCGAIIEENGEDYLNDKIFKTCFCYNETPIVEDTLDLFSISEGYRKYHDGDIGLIIETDEIIKSLGESKLLVKCIDCGCLREVDEDEFYNERTLNYKLCSCKEKKKLKEIIKGQRYGHLTVKDVGIENVSLLCDCGKEVIKPLNYFKGHIFKYCSKECRLNKFSSKYTDKSFIGHVFNNLKVLNILQRDTYNKKELPVGVYWRCQCLLCGREKIIYAKDVVDGVKKDCGCNASLKYILNYPINSSIKGIKILDKYIIPNKGTLWKCECPVCKDSFIRDPNTIVMGHCSSCGCEEVSIGEGVIFEYLQELKKLNNFIVYRQKTFDDLVSSKNAKLFFDFCIEKENRLYLIEFDGEQHKDATKIKGVKDKEKAEILFKGIQERDNLKNEYAKKNGIPLLRIDYTRDKQRIKEIVMNFLKMEGVI